MLDSVKRRPEDENRLAVGVEMVRFEERDTSVTTSNCLSQALV